MADENPTELKDSVALLNFKLLSELITREIIKYQDYERQRSLSLLGQQKRRGSHLLKAMKEGI